MYFFSYKIADYMFSSLACMFLYLHFLWVILLFSPLRNDCNFGIDFEMMHAPTFFYPSCSVSSIFVLLNRACPSNTHTYRLSTWMPMNGNSYYNSQFNKFLNKWHYGDQLDVSDEVLDPEKSIVQTISESSGTPGFHFRNEDGLFIVASQCFCQSSLYGDITFGLLGSFLLHGLTNCLPWECFPVSLYLL